MILVRIFLVAIACVCALLMFAFYKMSFGGYDSIGAVFWSGMISGQFEPEYFAMLYLPPIIFVACIYFALADRGLADAWN
jgi:hypothetical protein